jgi:hypothetical protein
MTTLLEKAFEAAAKLPQEAQNALAERILAELEADARWDTLIEQSQDVLEVWAQEALAEHRAGKTTPVERKKK